jgi:nicotinate-nucleotide adenylyltransferase
VKLGIFGGTFDPVHTGHLIAAEEARQSLGLDEVLFVPAGQPWLKSGREITDGGHRLAMLELAVAPNPYFRTSDTEIRRDGPSYTVDTLEEMAAGRSGGPELYVIVGMDALAELGRWRRPQRLLELGTLVAVARPGYQDLDRAAVESIRPGASDRVLVVDGPLIGISATEIRRRVAEGLSIKHWVPAPAEAYIYEHGLYGAEPEGGGAGTAGAEAHHRPAEAAEAILELSKRSGALRFGEFTLSSGGTSSYYFDGRLVTLDPEGAYLVAEAFLPILAECRAEAIAGPTVGADPIVSSVAVMSFKRGTPVTGLIVRMEAKRHGKGRMIEGNLKPGAAVAVVDDSCSTGRSLLHAIATVEEVGGRVVKVMCILDRHQGGSDEIRRRGYNFVALLEADEDGNIALVRT